MNRRILIRATLAVLPAAALSWPVSAQPWAARQQASGVNPAALGRPLATRPPRVGAQGKRGGLTASQARTRIVNRTFTSAAPITVPPDSAVSVPYPSTIQVGGFHQGRILKARVSLLGFSHDIPDDLEIMVVSPGNVGVILMSDAGGFFPVSALTLTFDQDAPQRVPDNIGSGTFQPTNLRNAIDSFPPPAPGGVTGHSLNVFNNRNPNGFWRLFIVDSRPELGAGLLAGWALHLRVREPVRHRQGKKRRARRRARR
jgi:hypothetical protein